MDKIASDLKMSELKQFSLFKAYEALHSEASKLLLLAVQWKDLDDHFNLTRKALQEKLAELMERERNVEAREKELGERDSQLNSDIGLKSKRLSEIERAIEERRREVDSLNLSIQERRQELEIAARQSSAAKELAAGREKEVDYLKSEIKDRAKKLEVLETSLRQRSEEVESKGKELGSVQGMLKKCRDDLDSKERQIQSIRRSLEDQRKEFVLREEQIKMKEERLRAIEDSIAECNIDLEMKEKELDLIQQDFELKKRNFVSLKKSVEQCVCEFDSKEKKFDGLGTTLKVKETSAESKIEELGLTYKKKVNEFLKEVELKEKNLASLQRLVEERFHDLEKREGQFEATRKEFDSIRNTLAFRAMVKTNAPDSRVKIESSDDDRNCDDCLSFASYQYCITNGHFLQVLLSEQLKKQESLCTDIFTVLQRSPNPAKLVLDAVQGFYPLHSRKENTSLDLSIVRSGCILLLEQLTKVSLEISPQVREEAMKLAGEWKAKMTMKAENFLEVLGFVQLLASYGLAAAFDADEISSFLDVLGSSRQASELRQTLCIADKAPVDNDQAENLRSNANIAASSSSLHSSAIQIGRTLELAQHEDSISKSLTQDDILAALQIPDPAKHVLGIVEGSFRQLWKRDVGFEASFIKSYVVMFQQLMKNSPQIQPHVREDAMKLAKEWRPRIGASTENYLEVLGFLQFLAVYGLVSSFNENDISSFLEMISRNKLALEMSGALGFAYEIPEFVEDFLRRKRTIEAVRLALAFKLTDKFPPTKLLAAYMEDAKSYTRQFCERKNTTKEKDEVTDREIAALRAVVQCIKDYNMESQFQPEAILKRIALLEKIKKDRKDLALFFASSDEQQQQQESCNKRRKSSLSPLEPLQSKKFCHRKALSTAKFSDLPGSKPVSQHANSLPKQHGTALASHERNVVLGFSSGVVQKRAALPD